METSQSAEETLGHFLRAERERRGLTIEQVASATKIAVKYLHSLEEDRYSELPAKPFIRGFVTSYARFIGLDSKEVLSKFARYIDTRSQERPNRESGHKGYAFESRDSDQKSRMYLSLILGVLIVGGSIALILKPSLRGGRKHSKHATLKAEESAPVAPPVTASPPPETTAAATGAPPAPTATLAPKGGTEAPLVVATPVLTGAAPASPTPTPSASASSGPQSPSVADPLDIGKDIPTVEIKHRIQMKALASVWVRYQVDQKPLRKFVMRKDAVLILKARSTIRFQVSNPRSATINYNGKGTKLVAEAAGVQEIGGNSTLVLGENDSNAAEGPFPGAVALPATPDPTPESPPAPTPELSTSTP